MCSLHQAMNLSKELIQTDIGRNNYSTFSKKLVYIAKKFF